MLRTPTRPRSRPHRYGAFTLIELLVVISIIALLISILLPVLGNAREAARQSVCLGHLRGAGQGLAVYYTTHKGWLPGPGTSGSQLTVDGNYSSLIPGSDKPTQNFDWVSPTLGGDLGLPTDAAERVAALFNEEFRCPANQETYSSMAFGDLTPPAASLPLSVSSYSTPSQFHVLWRPFPGGNPPDIYARSFVAAAVEGPVGYEPKIDRVGQASLKVSAMDGARYVDKNTGVITFNTSAKQIDGGNFGTWGPAMFKVINNGNPYKRDNAAQEQFSRRFAYRHNGETMNASYFDGHGAAMDVKESHRVTPFFPSGSVVNSTANLDDDSVAAGDIIN